MKKSKRINLILKTLIFLVLFFIITFSMIYNLSLGRYRMLLLIEGLSEWGHVKMNFLDNFYEKLAISVFFSTITTLSTRYVIKNFKRLKDIIKETIVKLTYIEKD